MPKTKPIPSDIGEYIRLDPETGKLWWIKKPAPRTLVGDEAFTANHNGYRRGRFRRQPLLAHRVVWFLYHGTQPPAGIDHINGDTTDNRPDNLREACQRLNARNARLRKDSKTGVKGVRDHADSSNFQGYVRLDGRVHYTGWFPSIVDAEVAVRKLREDLHGAFHNHGHHL